MPKSGNKHRNAHTNCTNCRSDTGHNERVSKIDVIEETKLKIVFANIFCANIANDPPKQLPQTANHLSPITPQYSHDTPERAPLDLPYSTGTQIDAFYHSNGALNNDLYDTFLDTRLPNPSPGSPIVRNPFDPTAELPSPIGPHARANQRQNTLKIRHFNRFCSFTC